MLLVVPALGIIVALLVDAPALERTELRAQRTGVGLPGVTVAAHADAEDVAAVTVLVVVVGVREAAHLAALKFHGAATFLLQEEDGLGRDGGGVG